VDRCPPRTVRLDGARTLEIREVSAADLAGLQLLYSGLDEEALCLRFFSLYRPRASFFERLTTVAARGGIGLVAIVIDSDHTQRLVAEGSVELLPNGNGEFALTVERSWRGWLGAYLLDTLVEDAASLGIPNLEAEILARNRPMLALVRRRGYVVVPSRDWTEVRVVIGARQDAPTWGDHRGKRRVLVEGPGSGHWNSSLDFPDDSAIVLACAGPGGHLPCPATERRPCSLAAGADLIVLLRLPDTDVWRAVTSAHPLLHPGVPVHVETA